MAGHCRDRPTPPQHAWRTRKPHQALGLVCCVSLSYTLQRTLLTWYMRSRPKSGARWCGFNPPESEGRSTVTAPQPKHRCCGRLSPQARVMLCITTFSLHTGAPLGRASSQFMANQRGLRPAPRAESRARIVIAKDPTTIDWSRGRAKPQGKI